MDCPLIEDEKRTNICAPGDARAMATAVHLQNAILMWTSRNGETYITNHSLAIASAPATAN